MRLNPLRALILLFWCATLSLTSCGQAADPNGDTRFNVGYSNPTREDLKDAVLQWSVHDGDFREKLGWLHPGGNGTFGVGATEVPAKMTFTWRGGDGKVQSKVFEVRKLIADPQHFKGTVWIKFTADGPQVIPLTRQEMEDRYVHDKEVP